MTLDKIIPRLQAALRREDPDLYTEIMQAYKSRADGAYLTADHPYWSSEECFALYEDLLKALDGVVDLEEILNA